MKRANTIIAVSCALTAAASVAFVGGAASQPRITTTPQIQVVGAAANSQSHGAWFVDLQSRNVIFCERIASRMECNATSLP